MITKDEIGENVSHLEIIEVILVCCNIVDNDYQQDSRESCMHLFEINHSINY